MFRFSSLKQKKDMQEGHVALCVCFVIEVMK